MINFGLNIRPRKINLTPNLVVSLRPYILYNMETPFDTFQISRLRWDRERLRTSTSYSMIFDCIGMLPLKKVEYDYLVFYYDDENIPHILLDLDSRVGGSFEAGERKRIDGKGISGGDPIVREEMIYKAQRQKYLDLGHTLYIWGEPHFSKEIRKRIDTPVLYADFGSVA